MIIYESDQYIITCEKMKPDYISGKIESKNLYNQMRGGCDYWIAYITDNKLAGKAFDDPYSVPHYIRDILQKKVDKIFNDNYIMKGV